MEESSLKSYTIGFGLCLLLTFASFALVMSHALTRYSLFAALGALALIQAVIQLVFFLHMGKESKTHENILVLVFMILVLFIIVIGSLWIMYNLDYRMMEM